MRPPVRQSSHLAHERPANVVVRAVRAVQEATPPRSEFRVGVAGSKVALDLVDDGGPWVSHVEILL
jgi:hypothetical protein